MNNIRYINGNFVNCCQPQECEVTIISQKSEKHMEARTSEVLEKEILETKIHFLTKLLQSANEKNEILKMNNALLIQKIEASELSIPRKEHKPAASVNFNIPKQMVLPNDPNVETSVVEINRDVYSYRNAVTAAPKLISIDKIDPKSFANENHDTSKHNSPKLSQSQEKSNIERRDNTHNSNDENLKEDNEIKSSWTTVVKRKPYKCRSVICTGSKEVNPTSKVKGVIKRKWVYVGKIYGQDVTEIDMKEFLIDSTGTEDFVIKKTFN
ncbi:hypothetical protein WA026_022941 [Henosepilachna vigintioctopunctata]|uniref:Uncharacterized protein n=1 Tax=Henosepilachna vigintioctopunctata TaxID=420089 RepID=A0AAW1TYM9_9CUCU